MSEIQASRLSAQIVDMYLRQDRPVRKGTRQLTQSLIALIEDGSHSHLEKSISALTKLVRDASIPASDRTQMISQIETSIASADETLDAHDPKKMILKRMHEIIKGTTRKDVIVKSVPDREFVLSPIVQQMMSLQTAFTDLLEADKAYKNQRISVIQYQHAIDKAVNQASAFIQKMQGIQLSRTDRAQSRPNGIILRATISSLRKNMSRNQTVNAYLESVETELNKFGGERM